MRAYIGLGANVGDAETTLRSAIEALDALPGGRVRAVSRLYATEPVGVTDQPEFRNAVVALDVGLASSTDSAAGALALLTELKGIERAFGRRQRERWGPRELDLDLLLFGRAQLAVERPPAARSVDASRAPGSGTNLLVVPHPAADSRLFVLAPLADLAPGLVPPGWGRSVETARRERFREEGPGAARPIAAWDAVKRTWAPLQPR